MGFDKRLRWLVSFPGPLGQGNVRKVDVKKLLQRLHWRASVELCAGGCLVLCRADLRAGCQMGAVKHDRCVAPNLGKGGIGSIVANRCRVSGHSHAKMRQELGAVVELSGPQKGIVISSWRDTEGMCQDF